MDLSDNTDWQLASLTPQYSEAEHEKYVRAIISALDDKTVRNIALSGNYGVGKSSILQEVAKRQRDNVVELSLSTLAPIETIDNDIPEQATTTTNRIQQEIVKQLLYSTTPQKLRGSRFRRIESFDWCREIAFSGILGIIVTVVFFLAGWTDKIAAELKLSLNQGSEAHLIIFLFSSLLLLAARHLSYGQLYVKQLSTGTASITLDSTSTSYFDQYLDEIVYFFEATDRNLVIFEDIDRFDDADVFETLRALNTLLNASPQIKNGPIRFIYATKDSIFDPEKLKKKKRGTDKDDDITEDPAQAELARANRTKFFDQIIPVVPFITHRSARSISQKLMQELDANIDSSLIDLASQHVPDMRLLKNVRNEFLVFRDRIFSGDGQSLELSDSELFAMILYKNTHLADFEEIRTGHSNLDKLYDSYRKLVSESIRKIEQESRGFLNKLDRLNEATNRSAQLGNELIAHSERTLRAAGVSVRSNGTVDYLLNGDSQTAEELKGNSFWLNLASTKDAVFECQYSEPYGSRHRITISQADLSAALHTPLSPDAWNEAERKSWNAALEVNNENLEFLRGADIGCLINRTEFTVTVDGQNHSLAARAEIIIKSQLGYKLLRSGYINRNFTLYTSTFHGTRVSPAATNFIIHHVERNLMDEHFELNNEDAADVIHECDESLIGQPVLYNIAILDHLLRTDQRVARIMIKSLNSFGSDQKRFTESYLSSGTELIEFVTLLAKTSSKTLVYLASVAGVEEAKRIKLVSTALQNLDNNMEYQLNPETIAYLTQHHADFPALTTSKINIEAANKIAFIFSEVNIQVPALGNLSEPVQKAFIAKNLYQINTPNLAIALGPETSMALDSIEITNEGVYQYVLSDLPAYLTAIKDKFTTVESVSDFASVITEVTKKSPDQLDQIVAQASRSCVITDLQEVPEAAWTDLARFGRFICTFQNVTAYINAIGKIDSHLAEILTSANKISQHESADETEKEKLALTILSATKQLPSAALRTHLVSGLSLDNHLDAALIPAENGELFSLLIEKDVIYDDLDTYSHLAETNWATRESYISASSSFQDYMTPELVLTDLAKLMVSDKITADIKYRIIEDASDYLEGSSKNAQIEFARYCAQHNHQIPDTVITQLANSGASPPDIITLLQPLLAELSNAQLSSILQSLGKPYAQLTTPGRDRPKFSGTDANIALLERLNGSGIVTKVTPEAGSFRVSKRHQ